MQREGREGEKTVFNGGSVRGVEFVKQALHRRADLRRQRSQRLKLKSESEHRPRRRRTAAKDPILTVSCTACYLPKLLLGTAALETDGVQQGRFAR